MASSLIDSIHSALSIWAEWSSDDYSAYEVMIELRNLKVLLIIGSRKLGDAHFINSSFPSADPSLFSWTQDADDPSIFFINEDAGVQYSREVHRRVKEVEEEVYTALSGAPLLTVDDVVAIADTILLNRRDFPSALSFYYFDYKIDVKAIDGFVEEIQFLRNFLVFANCTSVQLNNLLILIQPIVINAAHVFVRDDDGTYTQSRFWIQEVGSKCSKVNGMVIELQIYHAYSQALSTGSQYAGMDDNILMCFHNSLISLLWDVLRQSDSRPDQFIVLYERLRSCRAILKQHLTSFDRKMKDQIGGLMRDSGSLICSIRHADGEIDFGLISLLQRGFDIIEAEIQNTPSQTSESNDLDFGDHYSTSTTICHGEEKDLKVHEDAKTLSHQPPQTATSQVVGFQDEEVQTILDRLTRGSNQLRIVPVYGMAGIGKTTFALKLYNHRSIMNHFQARAWCTISQVLDKKRVLVQLLNQIDESDNYSEMTNDDLADTLRRRLKGKRYLILLDDVWTIEVWNTLQLSFPDDSKQSRIILTSRHSDVSPHGLINEKPYSLRPREDHECLDILQKKLFREEGWNPDIGMEIAKLCKGLPLMTVIISGLLASVKQEYWKGILDQLSSCGLSSEEQCSGSLELSYKHLPDDLKLCFLYIGAFPEDEQVSVRRLIRLWMAEGFVKRNGLKTAEDVGREYLENLIHRSLVMVAQSRSTGGAKSCRIHDIMRDFCMKKARQENSFHILHGDDQLSDFNGPRGLQRLCCINSNPFHFQDAKLFCPHTHSLLLFSTETRLGHGFYFDMSFIIQIFKLLKVLDLQEFRSVSQIPSEIEVLTRLTYLSVQSEWGGIPYSICNLSNLETLMIKFALFTVFSFPATLWNLQKLKYLQVHGRSGSPYYQPPVFSLPNENPESSSNMLELETLSGIQFKSDGSMEKQLKKFSNIRRLKCTILPHVENSVEVCKIVVPNFLDQLQSLNVYGKGKLQCEFGSAQKLRKVTLRNFELSREEISVIGKLPNLKVLKLIRMTFPGEALEMEEGDFSKLEIFHLIGPDLFTRRLRTFREEHIPNLRRWTASDEQLPNLQKLVFRYCEELVEIPSTCLEASTTLDEIQVRGRCSTLKSLVRDIAAVHEDFGNFVKVIISSLS